MYKFITQLFALSLGVLVIAPHAKAQFQPPPGQQPQQEEPEDYSESALRRFEIITLSSLPFTAIHSYAVVRGIKMYTENQFAPELSPTDYRIIGVGAASLSLFIGLWDWLHTAKLTVPRRVFRSERRLHRPKRKNRQKVQSPACQTPRHTQQNTAIGLCKHQ